MPFSNVTVSERVPKSAGFALVAIWLNWAICAISYVIMLSEVETVLGSGPLIFVCGLLLLVLARLARYRAVAWIAIANLLVCLLFFGLVNTLHWSPGDAEIPFALMGAGYVMGMLPLVRYVRRQAPRLAADRCTACGYLLIGLPEPRCPECGTPFDPATVPASPDV